MGQKVNPHILRVGITRPWAGRWYAGKDDYSKALHQDFALRTFIQDKYKNSGISRVEIERFANKVHVNIYTSKPGLIIGRQGDSIQKLKVEMDKKFEGRFEVNIREIKKPDLDARIVAANIAHQISRRIPYRRAVKSAITRILEAGAKGVKVQVAGRLNGAEIARTENFKEGNIPLHTFRSDIDYVLERAETTYGVIGVKVWIYKGQTFDRVSALPIDQGDEVTLPVS